MSPAFEAPGSLGADIAVGNSQRFGVHLDTVDLMQHSCLQVKNLRDIPGRIVGVSQDKQNQAYRLTLQTREQHIRREKQLQIFVCSSIACYHSECMHYFTVQMI